MPVINRHGQSEPLRLDKITDRLEPLCKGLSDKVDPSIITQMVAALIKPGMKTSDIDDLVADYATSKISYHPDFGVLAGRVRVSNIHKQTSSSFFETMKLCRENYDKRTGKHAPLVSQALVDFAQKHNDRVQKSINYERDYQFDEFAIRTLERSYLHKVRDQTTAKWKERIVERPQHMYMRVACASYLDDIERAMEAYELMSTRHFTAASPILFNQGRDQPGLISCFLLTMKDDSIEGIFDTLKQCAVISKQAGGIGLSVHTIRGSGSYIRGTAGTSSGLIPMLSVFARTAAYVDQVCCALILFW